jgi:hypothetical protein
MRVNRTGFVTVALVLATAPIALAGSPPGGSHGQESDAPKGAPTTVRIASTLARATVSPPRGSHGQETDARAPITVRVTAVKTRAKTTVVIPRGSHGQETDARS